jgi:hypothetical protein
MRGGLLRLENTMVAATSQVKTSTKPMQAGTNR